MGGPVPSVSLAAIILRHGDLGMGPLEKTGSSLVGGKKLYKHLLLAWWILGV